MYFKSVVDGIEFRSQTKGHNQLFARPDTPGTAFVPAPTATILCSSCGHCPEKWLYLDTQRKN
jgi:hypothetical protein